MLKIFLWGTGNIASKVLQDYDVFTKYDVLGFIDNDLCKQSGEIYGRHIYAPEVLLTIKADKIVILTVKYEEIYQQITQVLKIRNIVIEDWRYFQRQFAVKTGILKRYHNANDLEIRDVLRYIKQNDLEVFNYSFREKYKYLRVSVLFDENCGMFYVIHQGKRMYFTKRLNTANAVADYYKSILVEQDKESPHKYLDEEFAVCQGDVVIDAGVGEGNFALEIIDKVSKIYLIEMDIGWIEALRETFRDYQDKVVIIPKYLTSMNNGNYATLDCLVKEPINLIKMDIEGNEWDALLGAEKLIKRSKKVKCAICSYHTEYDETLIKSVLTEYGLRCTTTHGYMWFPSWTRDGNMSTKLCRGIVRGIR